VNALGGVGSAYIEGVYICEFSAFNVFTVQFKNKKTYELVVLMRLHTSCQMGDADVRSMILQWNIVRVTNAGCGHVSNAAGLGCANEGALHLVALVGGVPVGN